MQATTGRHRRAPNVSGVLWYLRLPENDVEQRIAHAPMSVDARGTVAKSNRRATEKSL